MTPGPLIASGRDADVFALDPRRVLRRYRRRPVPDREVAVMRYARERGFPVPRIHDVSGPDLVLDRVEGRVMIDDLVRRPWRRATNARILADLHRRLHLIPGPDFLGMDGEALLHLDLHPANVILSPDGPVVIDWANAARGAPGFDVALSAVVLASARIRPPLSWLRDGFVRLFLGAFSDNEWRDELDRAIAFRMRDANVSDAERATLAALRL